VINVVSEWRLIAAGIILVVVGAWLLYQGISAEYSKTVRRFDYVPTDQAIVADIVIGIIFAVVGSIFLSYKQGWWKYLRFGGRV
jgi:putative Mn2+ efflux pump MntP